MFWIEETVKNAHPAFEWNGKYVFSAMYATNIDFYSNIPQKH